MFFAVAQSDEASQGRADPVHVAVVVDVVVIVDVVLSSFDEICVRVKMALCYNMYIYLLG